jgi:hypothetical protein
VDFTSRQAQAEARFLCGGNKSPLSPLRSTPALEGTIQKVHDNQDFAAGCRMIPAALWATMTDEEERDLRAQLARLLQEHRDLDAAIAALQDSPGADILQVQRLKKRKLYLRDRINAIEDQLTPDIIA